MAAPIENSPPGIHTIPSGALPGGEFLFGIVDSNADDSDVSACPTAAQIHKQAIRILLFKSYYLVRLSVTKLQYSPVIPWRYDSRSLLFVVRWQYWTLGLHEHGFRSKFFQVSAENNRNIRETFGNNEIDRVIPAVDTLEGSLGFVSRTDRPTVRKRSSRMGGNRERQTFADQL